MNKVFEQKDRRRVLTRFIETSVLLGIDISDYVAKPLKYFNYEYLIKIINENNEDEEPEFIFKK